MKFNTYLIKMICYSIFLIIKKYSHQKKLKENIHVVQMIWNIRIAICVKNGKQRIIHDYKPGITPIVHDSMLPQCNEF